MKNYWVKFHYLIVQFFKQLSGTNDYWHPLMKYRDPAVYNPHRYYFIDISNKAFFPFELTNGLPIINFEGKPLQFSVTILNYGLGILDSTDVNEKALFPVLNWCLNTMDDKGLIPNPHPLPRYGIDSEWYSCLTQGLLLSFLIRAQVHIEVNPSTIEKVFKSLSHDSINNDFNDINFFQEFGSSNTNVLNGHLFCLFGILDYCIYKGQMDLIEVKIGELEHVLDKFNYFTFWSKYNSIGFISSRFYHLLHIEMLKSLQEYSTTVSFEKIIKRWSIGLKFLHGPFVVAKGFQKLGQLKHTKVLPL